MEMYSFRRVKMAIICSLMPKFSWQRGIRNKWSTSWFSIANRDDQISLEDKWKITRLWSTLILSSIRRNREGAINMSAINSCQGLLRISLMILLSLSELMENTYMGTWSRYVLKNGPGRGRTTMVSSRTILNREACYSCSFTTPD
jgi:hypothetical protein